ncbi:unnamed protein product [Larinioides sclopetarius]|uniref:Endonuclease/exonuclease/phosphatase domain-containing protein n=1 Tax=Larinioides sclopetarius TaxID=280406 RepID=A0AAV2BKB5_9ARAC
MEEWRPDILALQETHLNNSDNLRIPNYTTYRTDRTTHRGGGTAILIKNSINHHPSPIHTTSFENTTITLDTYTNTNILIASIYRPPHGIINTRELDGLFNQGPKAIAVGDFNAKHPAWNRGRPNRNGNTIHTYIVDNNLVLIAPPEPTHFPYNHPSSSVLDFGILKNISTGDATSLNDLSSDHNPVLFKIQANTNLSSPAKTYNIINWQHFSQLIHSQIPDNPKMDTADEIDTCINHLTNTINTALNLSTKTKVIKGKFRQLPKFILDKIKIKNHHRKLYQQTLFPPYKRTAHRLQKDIQKDIDDFDNNRWNNIIKELNPEDNTLYDMNKKLARKFTPIPPILDTDGIRYTPLGKADAFRHSLENFFQVNPEPYCNSHINKVNHLVNNYHNHSTQNYQIDPISTDEVITLIKKLNPKKATGPDGISSRALRMITSNTTLLAVLCFAAVFYVAMAADSHDSIYDGPGRVVNVVTDHDGNIISYSKVL